MSNTHNKIDIVPISGQVIMTDPLLNSSVVQAAFYHAAQEALEAFPAMCPALPGELHGTDLVQRRDVGRTVFSPGMSGLLDHLGRHLNQPMGSPLATLLDTVTQARSRVESGAPPESVVRVVASAISSLDRSIDTDLPMVPTADLVLVTAAAYALGEMHRSYGASDAATNRLMRAMTRTTVEFERQSEAVDPISFFLNDRMLTGLAFFNLHRIDRSFFSPQEQRAFGRSFLRLGLLSGFITWPSEFCLPNHEAARQQIYGGLDLAAIERCGLARPYEYVEASAGWRENEGFYLDAILARFLDGGETVHDDTLDLASRGIREVPASPLLKQFQNVLINHRESGTSREAALSELVRLASMKTNFMNGDDNSLAMHLNLARGRRIPDYSHLTPGSLATLPIDHIVPTQGVVFVDRVQGYLKRGIAILPSIVVQDGVPYVSIGHHRIMTQRIKGQSEVQVQVHDPSQDPPGMKLTVRERATSWDQIIWRLSQGGPVVADPMAYLDIV